MTVVGRFLVLLILAVIFGVEDCKLFDLNEDAEAKVRKQACSLECSDEPCITNCIRTKQIKELDEKAGADVRLICRDQSYLVLGYNPGDFVTESRLQYSNSEYSKWKNAFEIDAEKVVFFGLRKQTSYQFRSHRISASGISMPEITTDIETFPDGYRPMDVTSTTIGRPELEDRPLDSPSWKVRISFLPSGDRPCYYEVTCQQDDGAYNQTKILERTMDFSVIFGGLPFAGNFTLTVKSLTDELKWKYSNDVRGTIATFSTARCLELHGVSLCVPNAVIGLNVTATHKTGDIFDVNLTWAEPDSVDQFIHVYYVDLHPIDRGTKNRFSKWVGGPIIFVVFRNVTILDQYEVYVRARNRIGPGLHISRRFTALKPIVPLAVEGLNATVTPKTKNTFDIHVTWDRPEVIPDFYIVNVILNGPQTDHPGSQKIFGTNNETVFSGVEISEEFNVSVKAWSTAGGGPEITQRFIGPQTPNHRIDVPEDNRVPIYLGGTVMILAIGSIIAAYGYYRFRKRRLNKPVDKFEMSPDRLIITRVLGTGAFGVVKLGSLRDDEGNITNVAVKMLQDDSIENELRSFRNEIELMKSIGRHPNLVSILGCCTTSPYPFLVVEYCSRGDLQSYLRKSLRIKSTVSVGETKKCTVPRGRSPIRKEIVQENREDSSTSGISDDYIQVEGTPEDRDTNSDAEIVTMMDMLNFGRQIATGMEFLSSSRIVHRDLATRNVLVCRDRSVKISDFGLSRDVYEENFYIKWGNGRMPLKWMAIEALTYQVYTTHSDVWSFGILLWEIVTLGGSPYPGVPTIEILARLLSGYRMTRPANCSDPLYNVMLSCWQERPKDRPTFTTLRQELDKLICAIAEDEYFDLKEVPEETPP